MEQIVGEEPASEPARKASPIPGGAGKVPAAGRHPLELVAGRLIEVAVRYQRVLARDPHNPEALVGLSLVALASHQPEPAVKMAMVAVTVAPGLGAAWVAMGQALKSADRAEEAERAYEAAIRIDGMDPLARMGLGELKIATGRPEEAIREFDLVLRRQPALVTGHMGLGHAFGCMDRFAEALEHYERALSLHPRLPEAEFAAAFALARLGRTNEAEIRYRRVLVWRPNFAAAWLNLGCLLRDQGRELHAEAALRRSLELRPDMVGGWINLSLLERDRRCPEKAVAHLRRAFELEPERVDTHIAWCQLRVAENDMAGAWGWLRWALARNPENHEVLNTQGILLHNERRFEQAVAALEHAEKLGSKQAASNRGNSLLELGRAAEALRAHEIAVERDPSNPGARYNLALTQLRMGEWKTGWANYEARWSFREVHRIPRMFQQPRWRGDLLDGKRVLLHAEQGLGDTIQFCRFAAHVAARSGIPILQVQQPAARLLRSLAVVRSGAAKVALLGEQPPDFDLECPLMSLPAVFGTTVETVSWTGAYLGAEPDEMAGKRAQISALGKGKRRLRVGIAWAGNPRYKADRQRSTRLDTFLPLLRVPGIDWISLQKGEAAGQIGELPKDVCIRDASGADRDLAETAALIACLDLVVTTDTCIAHLAGAMGKPVWILLPHLGDWRWMQDIDTTPWYPTARLIRQSEPGDWGGVIGRALAELPRFERMALH